MYRIVIGTYQDHGIRVCEIVDREEDLAPAVTDYRVMEVDSHKLVSMADLIAEMAQAEVRVETSILGYTRQGQLGATK